MSWAVTWVKDRYSGLASGERVCARVGELVEGLGVA